MIPLEKYPFSIRLLHWLIAVMIIGLLTIGLIMTGMAHDNPSRATLYSLHKSFGITVLLLGLLRLWLRLRLYIPPLPEALPALERKLAHYGHYMFYVFMVAMPVSGYVMSTSYGLPVKWFGLELPRLLTVDKARGQLAADFHAWAAYTLIALIVLHVAGVLKHLIKERINLLARMT